MAKLRAIIFDVVGTLIYPAEPIGETYARLARAHGVRFSAETATTAFHETMKNGSPRAKGTIPNNGDDRAWWREIVRASLPAGVFPNATAFETFFESAYLHYATPAAWGVYPEVMEVFAALRDHDVDLCALTNWDGRLHAVIDGLGLGEYLPHRFISAELGWEKPDPAIYRHVSEALRLPPAQLLSVGDDPRNDIQGPRKAGWQTVAIERPKRDLWSVPCLLRG